MDIPEFASIDTLRRLWWLHDSFWHAALVKELGFEQANRINLEAASPTTLYKNLIEGMSQSDKRGNESPAPQTPAHHKRKSGQGGWPLRCRDHLRP